MIIISADIVKAISTVGFPIVACAVMGLAIWKMYLKIQATLDIVTETNKELALTNSGLIKNIDHKVDKLENKIDKILISK